MSGKNSCFALLKSRGTEEQLLPGWPRSGRLQAMLVFLLLDKVLSATAEISNHSRHLNNRDVGCLYVCMCLICSPSLDWLLISPYGPLLPGVKHYSVYLCLRSQSPFFLNGFLGILFIVTFCKVTAAL